MKLMIELDFPDNFEPCIGGCQYECPLSHYNDDTRDYDCDHIMNGENGWECVVSKAMQRNNDEDVKDKECKVFLHTYKCSSKSCKGCSYRYEKGKGEENG